MVFQKYIIYLTLILTPFNFFAQKFGFDQLLSQKEMISVPFSIQNTEKNQEILKKDGITIKRITENWIFITTSPQYISKRFNNKKFEFYFEYAPPTLLDDSVRAMFDVNPVHSGQHPLMDQYTGKDVIIGLVDNGLDHTHPDFTDANGRNRVIRYWDQSITNPTNAPQPYNYGQIWYADEIQNGTITSNEESSGHGTSVTGICAGNGLANGRNKGMAPDADIIFVETNFDLPNWTLTVADACDFIFNVADSLNKPAVINLSIGSYLGSHDGNDPAAELMEILVNEKEGRIIVGAAGNSGDKPPYHAQQTLNASDTNFIWFENNPSGSLGANTVFFDLWSDISEATFHYSFGANKKGPSFENRAETTYRFAQVNVGTTIYDTLRNNSGDRIATLEIYTEYVGNNYHMQGFFSQVDSTDYRMRFSTTGAGKYDLWSGEWAGLNKIVTEIPSVGVYPPIAHYVMPDSAQSIVSSWNCSSDILSVANTRGRLGYIDFNGDQYYPGTDMTPPGKIAISSSRGPSRKGVIKPDISAAGQVTLGSAPMYMIGNSSYNTLLDAGGYHMRNGGTSMASPVIAGIAALYLERCPKGNVTDFKNDLFGTATSDNFTGITPNNRYGHGKVNAFDLLVHKNGNLKILGDTAICQIPVELNTNIPLSNPLWSNGGTTPQTIVAQPDTISVIGNDEQGCKVYSDTVIIAQGSPLENPTINILGETLIASNAPNYQWYRNDTPIPGATQQTYAPTQGGFYSVAIQGGDNCKSFSNAIDWTLNTISNAVSEIKIFPNPSQHTLNISAPGRNVKNVSIYTITGQELLHSSINKDDFEINISHFSSGPYLIKIQFSTDAKVLRFFKQ
ncbi:hypothetical protein CW751_00255 [Brumimicrobium salinarum]|uniref:Peptidase S8/S53 domain-containing protein n=1 Tax=Brumimicrobium salinarum TaxID=2058658 RepID=A0A2I0R5E4_9FLAO|nr:S8 family serine peptidase [Brumimicrobium salinarum]PKR81807.1 hypothetical protein CW751_00255 [Brumimicrobium salinarum]